MNDQPRQSRKHLHDPSQRRQGTRASPAATASEQGAATTAPGPLLFCPHCGMPSSFESETECRHCHRRF